MADKQAQTQQTPQPVPTLAQDLPMSNEDAAFYTRQRRSRSIALALALGAVVIIFYVVSLIQGPGIISRPY